MILALSIGLALLPSLAWLALFLREDVHPEPNKLVVRAFAAGALATIPAIILESGAAGAIAGYLSQQKGMDLAPQVSVLPEPILRLIFIFFGIALVEEVAKFLMVKHLVLGNANFDEPVDALLYLVIGGLGFAAVENVLLVSNRSVQAMGLFGPGGIFTVLGARFLSATLLHALASGIIGYTIARALFRAKIRRDEVVLGIMVATFVHGVYNELISQIARADGANIPALLAMLVGLLATCATVLWLMLQKLRAESRVHTWRHSGKNLVQIM